MVTKRHLSLLESPRTDIFRQQTNTSILKLHNACNKSLAFYPYITLSSVYTHIKSKSLPTRRTRRTSTTKPRSLPCGRSSLSCAILARYVWFHPGTSSSLGSEATTEWQGLVQHWRKGVERDIRNCGKSTLLAITKFRPRSRMSSPYPVIY